MSHLLPPAPVGQFECRVCHAHATGFHFNVQSCQACCAFFRRAITLNRHYSCQQADRNAGSPCSIHYAEQCLLCRACRLRKCLLVGMDRNAVRTPKDKHANGRTYFTKSGLKRNKQFARGALEQQLLDLDQVAAAGPTSCPGPLSSSSPSSSPSSSSSASPLLLAHPVLIMPQPSPVPPLLLMAADSTKDNNSKDKGKWDLLALLVEEEMRIAERRRILFCDRPVTALLGKSKACPFTKADIRPLRFQDFRRSIRTHILLVYEWLRVWPGFSLLKELERDQLTLLRKCVLYHIVLDPCFLTVQLGELDKFVLPNGTYVSTEQQMGEGWEDEPEISRETKMRIYWPLLAPLKDGIIAPMLRMQLRFEEFVALKAIVSFKMTLPDISFNGRLLLSRELDSLCRSLFKFYDSQIDLRDELARAERFGTLLLLLSSIVDTANTFVESHNIVQFFDLWQMDSLMLQFLLKKEQS